MTLDLRTSIFTEPRTLRRMFENGGHGSNLREQLAGSSSRSGRNRGAADEADAISLGSKVDIRGAAAEADAIGEQS